MNVAPQPIAAAAALSLADGEIAEIERANATGRQPIIFIHGLWLLRGSWNRWLEFFEEAGYVGLAPGWPDDPATVAEANANSRPMAGKTIGQVVDHVAPLIVTRCMRKALGSPVFEDFWIAYGNRSQ
jgi:non-heme chloroperoxidase